MPEEQKKAEENMEEEEEGINLLDYLIVLAKRKKLIIYITMFSAIFALLLSMGKNPSMYSATTTILPPERGGGFNAASQAILSQFAGVLGSSRNAFQGQDLYLELLNSRTLYDRIIDRFGLMNVSDGGLFGFFSDKTRERIRQNLGNKITIDPDLYGINRLKNLAMNTRLIKITVSDKDPKRAADMANAFAEELKKFVRELETADATERRLFFEDQLKKTKESLLKSEEAMKEFQEKTGVFQVEQQAGAIIEGIARLRAEVAAKEVELSVMKSYSTPNNPDLQRVAETIKGLKAELAKLEQKGGSNPDSLISTMGMPAIGAEYARKLRDFKYYEKFYELLSGQLEAAKMDETRETAQIQIIDRAIPPDEKTSDINRGREVLKGTSLGLFFSIFAVFFVEYLSRQSKKKKNKEKLGTIKDYLSLKK